MSGGSVGKVPHCIPIQTSISHVVCLQGVLVRVIECVWLVGGGCVFLFPGVVFLAFSLSYESLMGARPGSRLAY